MHTGITIFELTHRAVTRDNLVTLPSLSQQLSILAKKDKMLNMVDAQVLLFYSSGTKDLLQNLTLSQVSCTLDSLLAGNLKICNQIIMLNTHSKSVMLIISMFKLNWFY